MAETRGGKVEALSYVPKCCLRPKQCYFEARQIATIAASLFANISAARIGARSEEGE